MSVRWRVIVLLFLVPVSARAHGEGSPAVLMNTVAKKVSAHTYVMHGPRGLPNRENGGFMSNPGFVVTDRGVVVVDPGASAQIGGQLIQAIRGVTDLPVVAIFNTHIHGDHWLGNDGIRRSYPKAVIYAHRNMVERRDSGEAQTWIERIEQMTGGATAGTRVVWPEVGVSDGQILEIGGVRFRIHDPGKAHTDTDILIEVLNDKAVFLGDVVVHRSFPTVRPQDASLSGYRRVIRDVLALPVETFMPGHGPTGDRTLVIEQLGLMDKLYAAVVRHVWAGLTDFEMADPIRHELADYRDWNWFDGLPRLISHVYLEVEAESFN